MSRQRSPATIDADKPLTTLQKSIVDHIMMTGHSVIEASEALGKDRRNIYRTLEYPHVRKYMHQQTLDHIGILAPIAARTQGELLKADSDHVKAVVAENILDRHLGKPVMRQQIALQGQIDVHIDLS